MWTDTGGLLSRKDVSELSRRDNRTEPGVLTPGTHAKTIRPEGAVGMGREAQQHLERIVCRPGRAGP
jgi:hypothetical protein